MAEKHGLRWFSVQSVPEDYIFPPIERPGEVDFPVCTNNLVIDLGKASSQSHGPNDATIQAIMNACQEFGFFQVINHGVSEKTMEETMNVYKDFFDMPEEEKLKVYAGRFNYVEEDVRLWRENLKHSCHPLHECIHSWPDKPSRYRNVVGEYSVEVRTLSLRILELISEGLGLGKGYFGEEFTEVQMLSVNHYPPCPEPSLTMGIPPHFDPNLITVLQSNTCGLQIFKDDQWMRFDPLPNAFMIIVGYQLEIISNGRLKSGFHRAVTNRRDPRTSIITFINPGFETVVAPAKALTDECSSPPLYRPFLYKDFLDTYKAKKADPETVLDDYVVQELRPGKLFPPLYDSIPVIDLGKAMSSSEEHIHTVLRILKAAQEFGFFQVINHGVPEKVIQDTMGVIREFFDMAAKDKAGTVTNDWLYTSSIDFAKDGVHLWRDNVKHPCQPLEECVQLWPAKPDTYREVVRTYLVEIRKLSLRILEFIGEGLGLEKNYFSETSEIQLLSANNYPPCPDPSLTLGILKHCDPSLITILFQSVCGLQVLKDGQWISIGALPNAFVVNIGNQLEIISNGKLKSAEHRAVTNLSEVRTSIATFITPSPECIVKPAKVLISELNPPRYGSSLFKEFVNSSKAFGPKTDVMDGAVSELLG